MIYYKRQSQPAGRRCAKIYFSDEICEPTQVTLKLYITSLNSQFLLLGPRHKMLG
jgi:hypothetical protein